MHPASADFLTLLVGVGHRELLSRRECSVSVPVFSFQCLFARLFISLILFPCSNHTTIVSNTHRHSAQRFPRTGHHSPLLLANPPQTLYCHRFATCLSWTPLAPACFFVFVQRVIGSSIVLDCMSPFYPRASDADCVHKGTARHTRFASFSSPQSSSHHSSTLLSPSTQPLNLASLPTFPPRFSTPSLPQTQSLAMMPNTTFAISGLRTTAFTFAMTLSFVPDVASSRRYASNAYSFTAPHPPIPRR